MRKLIIPLLFIISLGTMAQDQNTGLQSLGLESQMYPAGLMFNLKADWPLSDKGLLVAKVGYNIAERQDFGEHDQEDGEGPGLALGYKRYLKTGRTGLYAEARLSVWFLDIDWRDNAPARFGNTDITVLQPTVAAGYDFYLKGDKLKLGVFVAGGYEVNIVTSGEEVGQGGISIMGATISIPIK